MKNILVTAILISIGIYSCRKEPVSHKQSTDGNHLKFATENVIRINQAVVIYDSVVIHDSIDFVVPPSDKYYEWVVTPGNGCDSIAGDAHKGKVEFIFHCAGTYLVSATIFDSLTHSRIGNTEAVEVKVTTDTLFATQPIQGDDVLNIKPGVVRITSHDPSGNPIDEIDIQLVLQTSKLYVYHSADTQFDYESILGNNSYTFNFANTIKSNSYPFANGGNVRNKVDGALVLKGLKVGVPAALSITWLNIRYTGSVTLINEHECVFDWDNTGTVIIRS